jgi:hypothetical protein
VGPLLANAYMGRELTDQNAMPRWLVGHRMNTSYATGEPQCVVDALHSTDVVEDGTAFRNLVWSEGGEQPRMIVRAECTDLLAALKFAKSVIAVRFVSRLRMRAAIARGGLQLYSPDKIAPTLEATFDEKQAFAKATQRAMHAEQTYRQFFARNLQQQQQIDTAYGAAKRTQEQTTARTMSEYDHLDPVAKRRRGE